MKIMNKMIHDIQAKESEKEMLHTLQNRVYNNLY